MGYRLALDNVAPALAPLYAAYLLERQPEIVSDLKVSPSILTDTPNCGIINFCFRAVNGVALNVPPRSSSPYASNAGPVNAKFCGDFFRGPFVIAYSLYLTVSQFSLTAALTIGRSPFLHHIFGIQFVGAKPQMLRVATGPVVASMADDHPRWDWAIGLLPRISVRPVSLPASLKSAVSRLGSIPRPFSATRTIWFGNPGPKIVSHKAEHNAYQRVRQWPSE